MHKKYYVLLDTSTTSNRVNNLSGDVTWSLDRHIPNGSKMRLMQFNWHAATGQGAFDNNLNGIVLHLQNIGNLSDFNTTYHAPPQMASTCILAQIPQESLFVAASTETPKTEGSYEPYNPCEVKISAPMTSINITLRDSTFLELSNADLANFTYSVLLEIDECPCE